MLDINVNALKAKSLTTSEQIDIPVVGNTKYAEINPNTATEDNYKKFAIVTTNNTDSLYINLKENGTYKWFKFGSSQPSEEGLLDTFVLDTDTIV